MPPCLATNNDPLLWMCENEEYITEEGCLFQEESSEKVKSTPQHKARNVSFSEIHIREYDVCVGDNPSCSIGPPISLDWTYRNTTVISVDDHEANRPDVKVKLKDMFIPSFMRYAIFKKQGYTMSQLTQIAKTGSIPLLKPKNQKPSDKRTKIPLKKYVPKVFKNKSRQNMKVC